MNYKKIYKSIIERAKKEKRVKNKISYYEWHHIVPVFMFKENKRNKSKINLGHLPGNPDDKRNKVLLTAREHFLAHVLLYKIYKGSRYEWSCGSSLMLFFNVAGAKHKRVTNGNFVMMGKKYENYRKAGIQSISNRRKGMMPVKDAKSGLMVGEAPTNHPKVLSGEWVHHSRGNSLSSERKAEIREQMNGMGNTNALSDFSFEDAKSLLVSVYNDNKEDRSIISKDGHLHKSRFLNKCKIILKEKYPNRKKAPWCVILNRIETGDITGFLNTVLNLNLIRCDLKTKFPNYKEIEKNAKNNKNKD